MVSNTILDSLVGAEVGGICFVRDDVELHFDGPILRALTSVTVGRPGNCVTFPEPGSRDALCSLICQKVCDVGEVNEAIVLEFSDGKILSIPLTDPGGGAEVAHFVPAVAGELDISHMVIWENLQP